MINPLNPRVSYAKSASSRKIKWFNRSERSTVSSISSMKRINNKWRANTQHMSILMEGYTHKNLKNVEQ